jgi:hypothetical protein
VTQRLRKGSAVEVEREGWIGPDRGTATQVTRSKVRVLFPIRKFVWLNRSDVKVVGFDGDGSSVHWR